MKKLFSMLLVALLLVSLAVPAMAADMEILFTADSSAKVGGHLEIDFNAMLMDGRVTSDIYNAILEKNYEIYWYRDGAFYSTQPKVIFGDSDANVSFSVEVRFYGDKACTVLWATLYSKDFKVESSAPPIYLRTTTVNDGAVGMYYSFKFEANDPGAEFSLFRSDAPDGLTFAKDGTLSGVPTKAGTYTLTVVAKGVGGETSYTYTVNIGGDMQVVKIMTEALPAATVGESYSAKLECSDKSATFGIYFNPGKANEFDATGLKLAENGTLSGTPAKEGVYTFWVGAYGETGENYKEYKLTVAAAEETQPTEGGKKPGKDKGDKTEKPEQPKATTPAGHTDAVENSGVDLKVIIAVLAGALVAAVVVIVVLATKKKS